MLLSICIPTYNRPEDLKNCIYSIYQQKKIDKKSFEVCVSDNCSNFNTFNILKPFKKKLNIKF